MIQGLRTCAYYVPDIEKAKAWYTEIFEVEPYFDRPFYVGFRIEGFELGLMPEEGKLVAGMGGSVAYWSSSDIEADVQRLTRLGAKEQSPITDVGDNVSIAILVDPFGNLLGLISNPNFKYQGGK